MNELVCFNGTGDVSAFIRSVKIFSCVNRLDEDQKMTILETLLEGEASIWLDEMMKMEPRVNSNEIMSELIKKYDISRPIGTLVALTAISPQKNEGAADFVKKISNYVSGTRNSFSNQVVYEVVLEKLHLFDGLINMVESGSSDVKCWPGIIQVCKDWDKLQKMDDVKVALLSNEDSNQIATKSNRSEVKQDTIESLSEKLTQLTLLLQEKDKKKVIRCYTCGDEGHSSKSCKTKVKCFSCGEEGHKSLDCPKKQTISKVEEIQFIDIDETEELVGESEDVLALKRMRMDVEDMLNPEIETMQYRRKQKGLVKQKDNKMKKIVKKKMVPSGLVDRVLDAPAPITIKDLLKLKPSMAQELSKAFSIEGRKKSVEVLFEENKSKKNASSSFVNVSICGRQLHLQVDNGAACSLVEEEFLKDLPIEPMKLNKTIKLRGVFDGNRVIEVNQEVELPLQFDEGVVRLAKFLVVPKSICPILLGIDTLEAWKCIIDYSQQILSFKFKGKMHKFQLYSREQALMLEGEEEEISSNMSSDLDDTEDSEIEEVRLVDRIIIEDKIKQNENVCGEMKEELVNILDEYKSLFIDSVTEIPGIKMNAVEISLVDERPIKISNRRYALVETEVINAEVKKMLEGGIIEKSQSPWSFPVVLAKKADNSWRFCVDYRKLNEITVRDAFPLPRVDDCLDSLAQKKFFSTLDFFSGYWQMKLDDRSKKYTAFSTPTGLYQFTVMPFGITNAPAIFSRFMEDLMGDLNFVTVYIDDICIHSKSWLEHLKHLDLVLARLKEKDVRLKLKKCHFADAEFTYLGFLVKDGTVAPSPVKVKAVATLKCPRNAKELKSFLGLVSYFRRFIADFAERASPLYRLVRKNVCYTWNEEAEESYQDLKNALMKAPVLQLPVVGDSSYPFILSTDASSFAIGAVLEQIQNEKKVVIAYYSRNLNKHEKNYSAYEKEGIALISALKHFRVYLLGTKFVIYTDNSALAHIMKTVEPTGRVARWIQLLMEFDFTVHHRSGKENVVADYLSRSVSIMNVQCEEDNDLELVHRFLAGEDNLVTHRRIRLMARKFLVIEGKLYRRSKPMPLLVLKKVDEIVEKLNICHDFMGHLGFDAVWAWMRVRFWNRQLRLVTNQFIRSCVVCQEYSLMKPQCRFDGRFPCTGFLHEWLLDFIGPFPESSSRNIYILVGVERLTQFPLLMACNTATASEVIRGLKFLISIFSVPHVVRSDCGTHFTARLIKEFTNFIGFRWEYVPPYTPEWSGLVEGLNRLVRYSLTKLCVESGWHNWDQELYRVSLALSGRVFRSRKTSPFELAFGVSPRLPHDVVFQPVCWSLPVREIDATILNGLRSQFVVDGKSGGSRLRAYTTGDLVMVLAGRLRKAAGVLKKEVRFSGPYKIGKVKEHNVYEVIGEDGQKKLVHVSRLKPYLLRCLGDQAIKGGSVVKNGKRWNVIEGLTEGV